MAPPTLPSPPAQALPIEQEQYGDKDDGDGDNGDASAGDGYDGGGEDDVHHVDDSADDGYDNGEDDVHHVDDSGGDHSLPFPLQALHGEALALGK